MHIRLFHTLLGFLYVVINSIQNSALLDHQHREVFEQNSQLVDRLRNIAYFLPPYVNCIFQL